MTDQVNPKESIAQFAESLSALRQTLPSEEQDMLDQMVGNTLFDVEAHSVTLRTTAATVNINSTVSEGKMAKAANVQDDIDDVEAHSMEATWKATSVEKAAVSDAAMANVQDDIDDVEAHALPSTDRLSAVEQRTTFKMNFSNLVGYEVRPEDDEDDVIAHGRKWM